MYTTLLLDVTPEFAAKVSGAMHGGGHHVEAVPLGRAEREMRDRSVAALMLDVRLGGEGVSLLRSQRTSGWLGGVVLVADSPDDIPPAWRGFGATILARESVTPRRVAAALEAAMSAHNHEGASPGADPSLEAALEALRLEYILVLPAEIEALRSGLVALEREPDSAPLATRLGALAHRLTGTTGSYGFRSLSDAIARFNAELTPGAAGMAGQLTALNARLAEVEMALRERCAGGGPAPVGRGRLLLLGLGSVIAERLVGASRRLLLECTLAADWAEAAHLFAGAGIEAIVIDAALALELRSSAALRALVGATRLAVVGDDVSTRERVLAAAVGASAFIGRTADAAACEDALSRLTPEARASACVVLVEDDPQFAEYVRSVLRPERMVVHVLATTDDLVSRLYLFKPDIILLDQLVPGTTGTDLCRAVRLSNRWQRLPVVMLTAAADRSTRLDAFAAGVDDFIQKPVLPDELAIRVRARLRRARDAEAHSDRDALTGLQNRRAFLEQLEGRLAEDRRQPRPLVTALIDVDHFKRVNDQHGHAAGDLVLATLGLLITRRVRAHDLRCRWGGEELALAFSGCRIQDAAAVVEEIRARFERSDIVAHDGSLLRVTFSAGLAEVGPDGADVASLMGVADRRLYRAKADGRNRVVWT